MKNLILPLRIALFVVLGLGRVLLSAAALLALVLFVSVSLLYFAGANSWRRKP